MTIDTSKLTPPLTALPGYDGGLWLLQSEFTFMGMNMGNLGYCVRVDDSDHDAAFLVLVNAPCLEKSGLGKALETLQEQEKAQIKYVFATDYHNIFLAEYVTRFPNATLVLPSDRVLKLYPKVFGEGCPGADKYRILDEGEQIPEVKDDVYLHWHRGFGHPKGMGFKHIDAKYRGEWIVEIVQHKTLFQFDQITAVKPGCLSWIMKAAPGVGDYTEFRYSVNAGKGSGFPIVDRSLCVKSVGDLIQVAKDHKIEVLASSHRGKGATNFVQGNSNVVQTMELMWGWLLNTDAVKPQYK
eukprot:GFYU01019539.1.p2 GENE.GFYU01019539.1~~GFYU01019539.1.p2  ORF type:complete len:297 (+),score=93.43 GFYU01019539.1:47-937(+)